jgi:anti-sigma B factor antagonist
MSSRRGGRARFVPPVAGEGAGHHAASHATGALAPGFMTAGRPERRADDPQPLSVARETGPGAPGVVLSGELDLAGAAEVVAAVVAVSAPGQPVEIDATGLTFIDSTGSQALVDAVAAARAAGAGPVTLVAAPDGHVARILALTGTWDRLADG